mmetsp:Transcript_7644/g.10003  ORF Transcript_7644/g.10003 Transcript_7644/m.10003 type:complete len:84 (-) Transcript_7644:328-579(-)
MHYKLVQWLVGPEHSKEFLPAWVSKFPDLRGLLQQFDPNAVNTIVLSFPLIHPSDAEAFGLPSLSVIIADPIHSSNQCWKPLA